MIGFFLFLSLCSIGWAAEKETIVFADAGWDSIRFHNAVAQFIVEEGYDYPTDVISGSTPATLLGLQEGDIDVEMEVWTGNWGDAYYGPLEEGLFKELSVNFDDNAQGLYVPTFVIEGDAERGIEPLAPDLKSWKDLEKYWEVFQDEEDPAKGRIYGSPPGWKVDEVLRNAIKEHNMDKYFNYFSPGSDSALSAAIVAAYERGEPIVAYYWEPTWVMGKLNMTLLEGIDGEQPLSCGMEVMITVNSQLPEKAPEVAEFLSHYRTSSQLTSEALAYMMESDADTEEAAEWFLKNSPDVWTKWVSDEIAQKVLEAL